MSCRPENHNYENMRIEMTSFPLKGALPLFRTSFHVILDIGLYRVRNLYALEKRKHQRVS
jgi:hypothetical protein